MEALIEDSTNERDCYCRLMACRQHCKHPRVIRGEFTAMTREAVAAHLQGVGIGIMIAVVMHLNFPIGEKYIYLYCGVALTLIFLSYAIEKGAVDSVVSRL